MLKIGTSINFKFALSSCKPIIPLNTYLRGARPYFVRKKIVINYHKKNFKNSQNESIILIRIKILLINRILKIFS